MPSSPTHPRNTTISPASLEAHAHPSYLSALHQIDRIAVPDLASTLTTASADNSPPEPTLSYLRARPRLQRHSHESAPRTHNTESQQSTRLSRTPRRTDSAGSMEERYPHLDRLERVLAQLNRIQSPNSGNTNQQPRHISPSSMRPWSPAHHDIHARQAELMQIQQDQREVMRMLASNDETMNQLASAEESSRPNLSPHPGRLLRHEQRRSRLLTRHRELLARSTEYQSFPPEPDLISTTQQSTERPSNRANASNVPNPEGYGVPAHRTRQPRPLSDQSGDISSSSVLLQDTLTYLSNLRHSSSREQSLAYALMSGFTYKDFCTDNFIQDLSILPRPSSTSLMASGAIFSGAQFANSVPPDISNLTTATGHLSSRHNVGSHEHSTSPLSEFWNSQTPRPPSDVDLHASASAGFEHWRINRGSATATDNWPVRVTLYDVNFESMSFCASMEAYDVPSHPQSSVVSSPISSRTTGTDQKPITTYLEGEILDLQSHTFVTESFSSSLSFDMKYWRKLPPFKQFSAAELPSLLLNSKFLAQINSEFVLMRWKERCFLKNNIADQPRYPGGTTRRTSLLRHGDTSGNEVGCGLTISGFYYISLRRSDGLIEGLYCDPQSSPYQYLTLRRDKSGAFPSWSFR